MCVFFLTCRSLFAMSPVCVFEICVFEVCVFETPDGECDDLYGTDNNDSDDSSDDDNDGRIRLGVQRNPVNTDTKGTGQIVRINGVSALSGVSEKKPRMHVFSTQRRRQTFLRQQNVV